MKKVIVIMVLSLLVAGLVPAMAQDWNTGGVSASGSPYSSQVTPVGAQNVDQQAITTYDQAAQPNRISGRRNEFETTDEPGYTDPNSPIGTPLAMLAFVGIAAGVVAVRRRWR